MKRVYKIILGLIVGCLFLWLAVRGVDTEKVLDSLGRASVPLAALSVLPVVLSAALRALRWQVVLSPMERLTQRLIFPITQVGYMASTLLPARLGELARPVLLARGSNVGMSAALATVVVERLMDSIVIVLLLIFSLNIGDVPQPVKVGARIFVGVIAAGVVILYVAYLKRDSLTGALENPPSFLPERAASWLKRVIESFLKGLEILKSPVELVYSFAFTLGNWACIGLSFYLVMEAFSLELPFSAGLAAMCLTALGVAVPTAPGFIGNFHYFFVLGLALFGVEKDVSLAAGVATHAINIGAQVILGLIFLPYAGASMGDLVRDAEEETV